MAIYKYGTTDWRGSLIEDVTPAPPVVTTTGVSAADLASLTYTVGPTPKSIEDMIKDLMGTGNVDNTTTSQINELAEQNKQMVLLLEKYNVQLKELTDRVVILEERISNNEAADNIRATESTRPTTLSYISSSKLEEYIKEAKEKIEKKDTVGRRK